VAAGLDRLWVSLDGATPASYMDVRLGAELPRVIANLEALRTAKYQQDSLLPRLGIAFVAMKRNIAELPAVIDLGKRLGADTFSVSHVLPYTPEMREEALYQELHVGEDAVTEWSPKIVLPKMELNAWTEPVLLASLRKGGSVSLARQELRQGADRCPFLEKGSLAVRWDGEVAPCLALLHDHDNYLGFRRRRSHAHSTGNIGRRPLQEIWDDPAYRALRERILAFDFSFCTECNSCDLADSNREDCFGNVAPTCGGCLWAQGLIQCP
jgi:MoaA/NifB/PqqE/SkfB family radical SAM enzyme